MILVYASVYTLLRNTLYDATEVIRLGVKDAVVLRFQRICRERNITFNELASRAGVTASSVYSMMDHSRRNVSIVLIKQLCDGLDISLREFFSAEEFDLLEQEIK